MPQMFLESERAKEQPPADLLKFRTFEAEGRAGKDSKTIFSILQGRIPFSMLKSFNDPFEGRPQPAPAYSEAGKQRDAMLRYLASILVQRGDMPTAARQKAEQLISGKSQDEVVEVVRRIQLKIFAGTDLMLFCTSSGDALKAPLTWSHYADSHHGICIHFNTAYPPFNYAWRVEYSEVYPTIIVPRIEADEWEPIQKGLLWKCNLWAYEHEYRLVRAGADNLGIQWDQHVAITSPKAITRVTLGVRIKDSAKKLIRSWASTNAPHVEFWQAKLHDRRFELEFDQIS